MTLGCHMKEWYILSFVYSDIWIMNNTWRSLVTCIQHYPVTTITCSSMYHITAYNWKQQLFWHNEVDTIQELKTQTHKKIEQKTRPTQMACQQKCWKYILTLRWDLIEAVSLKQHILFLDQYTTSI